MHGLQYGCGLHGIFAVYFYSVCQFLVCDKAFVGLHGCPATHGCVYGYCGNIAPGAVAAYMPAAHEEDGKQGESLREPSGTPLYSAHCYKQ